MFSKPFKEENCCTSFAFCTKLHWCFYGWVESATLKSLEAIYYLVLRFMTGEFILDTPFLLKTLACCSFNFVQSCLFIMHLWALDSLLILFIAVKLCCATFCSADICILVQAALLDFCKIQMVWYHLQKDF